MKKYLLFSGVLLIMAAVLTGCSPAGNYDKAGRKSMAAGDYEKAASHFQAAIGNNPDRGEYYIHYGAALTALGRYEEAISQFDRAYMDKDMLIVNRNDKKALRGKGIAYFCLKQFDKAVEAFDAALSIDELPELNTDILYYKAAVLKLTGLFEQAAQSYSLIVSENDKEAEAYAGRAACYHYLGDYDKSLEDMDSAIALTPDRYEYYFEKYYLMSLQGDESGAAAVLDEAGKLKAFTSEDKYHAAVLHYLQGDYDTALTELNESLAEGFAESNYYIGEIYRKKKDYEQAIFCYENYIAAGDVSLPGVYNQITVCLNKSGRYEEALGYLEKGLEEGNSDTRRILLKNEIITYEYLGEFDKAQNRMEEYLELYPMDQKAQKEADFIATRMLSAASEE